MKALALVSGGLDSMLAVKSVTSQGIEVIGFYFISIFNSETLDRSERIEIIAKELNIEIKAINISKEHIDMVKNPAHGYGKNINPCIDCKILMFKKTKEYMKDLGADFIISGEVLGQRPMSQGRSNLKLIERESGLEGFILRPLSAKALDITIPEEKKWIDREKLLAIIGRSRKEQFRLAEIFNLKGFSSPAGGCLLTDPGFAKRARDLMEHSCDFSVGDVRALKIGRHFRLSDSTKLIVGRNQQENFEIDQFCNEETIKFIPVGTKGPIAVGFGEFDSGLALLAGSILARYCDEKINNININSVRKDKQTLLKVSPLAEGEIEKFRI